MNSTAFSDSFNNVVVDYTQNFYNSSIIQSFGEANLKFVPSFMLYFIALSLVYTGAYASLQKPKNAEEPSPDHPLFDFTDIDPLPLELDDENLNEWSIKDVLLLPFFTGGVLMGLNYLFKTKNWNEVINNVLKYYTIFGSFFANYNTFDYFIKTINRRLCHYFDINSLDIITKYRVCVAVDSSVNPDGVVSNDKLYEKKRTRFLNALLSIIGLSTKSSTKKNQASEKQLKRSKRLNQVKDRMMSTIDSSDQLINFYYSSSATLSIVLSSLLTSFYYFDSNNFIISNLIAGSFGIYGMKLIKFDSFKTGILCLSLLFFYDVYFVFFSDAMMNVAKNISIPALLKFPKSVVENNDLKTLDFSILGLGDIVIPGLFVGLLLRFDLFNYHDSNPSTEYHLLNDFDKPYFTNGLIGYMIGLGSASFAMHYFEHGQPALLYLSPSIILSGIITSIYKKQFKIFFNYIDKETNDEKEEEKSNVEIKIENLDDPITWGQFLNEVEFPDEDEQDDNTYIYTNEEEIDEMDDDDDEFTEEIDYEDEVEYSKTVTIDLDDF